MRLDGELRVREISRMMGHESETTLQHAREMLTAADVSTQNGTAKSSKVKSKRK